MHSDHWLSLDIQDDCILEHHQKLPLETMPYIWIRNETALQSLLDWLTVVVFPWPESKAYFLPREFGVSGVTFMDDASAIGYLLNEKTSEWVSGLYLGDSNSGTDNPKEKLIKVIYIWLCNELYIRCTSSNASLITQPILRPAWISQGHYNWGKLRGQNSLYSVLLGATWRRTEDSLWKLSKNPQFQMSW